MTQDTDGELSTLEAAIRASAEGNSREAIALFAQASNDAPGNGIPLLLLAAEFASSGQMDRAEEAYSSALLCSPELLIARYQLGLLQLTSGRVAIAFLTWQPLLELASPHPLTAYALGYVALVQDQFEASIRKFEEGLAMPQDNPALVLDIQKTIAKVKQETSQPIDASSGNGADVDQPPHIFLSNYTDMGTRH